MPELGVTPRYITRKSPCNVGMAPMEGTLPTSRVFSEIGFLTKRVSRSALYRHFADKQSLLATVGKEGFRTLRQAVTDAWEQNGRGRAGFQAMGKAYVQFAVAHPSHYRVMFGGFIESAAKDDHFVAEAKAAFQVLVDALIEQQNAGGIRRDDPVLMGRFVWALVHGTALLVIDGQLPDRAQQDALEDYTFERIYASIRQETLPNQ